MSDIQSIVIYLGLPLVSFFVAKYAEYANSRRAVWLITVLFSLVAGFRAVTVGIDTSTYDAVFSIVSNGNVDGMYGIEESFIYICAGLLWLWNNNQFLLLVFAFISHSLVLFKLWEDRTLISFKWSVLSYYVLLFPFSLNGMRQFIAVAIVFYATGFIKEGKYARFIISILVAMLFHSSALVGLAYMLYELAFTKHFDAKRKMSVFLLVGIGSVASVFIISNLITLYSGYFEQQSSSTGLMMIVKIAMLALSFVVIPIPTDKDERYYCFSHRWNYFVGLLLNSLNYMFLYMGRVGLYFYIFEAIYIGYVFKTKNKTLWSIAFKMCYVAILMYYLYDNISRGAQGEIPYRFFWQE